MARRTRRGRLAVSGHAERGAAHATCAARTARHRPVPIERSLPRHLDDGELVVKLGIRRDVARRTALGSVGQLRGNHSGPHAALAHPDERHADACGDGLAPRRE